MGRRQLISACNYWPCPSLHRDETSMYPQTHDGPPSLPWSQPFPFGQNVAGGVENRIFVAAISGQFGGHSLGNFGNKIRLSYLVGQSIGSRNI